MSSFRTLLAVLLMPAHFQPAGRRRKARGADHRQFEICAGPGAPQPGERRQRHRLGAQARRLRGHPRPRRRQARVRHQGAQFRRPPGECRRRHLLLCRPRAAGIGAQLSAARRCPRAERARSRLRCRQPRLRPQADGAWTRRQDQHRVPRRLPRQSLCRKSGALHGHALGEHRQGSRPGRYGGRHLHRLLDATGERRARRYGPQFTLHRRARQARPANPIAISPRS